MTQEQADEMLGVLRAVDAILSQPIQFTPLEDNIENSHRKINIIRGDCSAAKFLIQRILQETRQS